MGRPLAEAAIFDRFSRIYDLTMPAADASVIEPALDRAERDVDHLLDLGGGTGRGARALSIPRRTVLDASVGMLEKAHGHGLDAVQGDAATIPLADESVDGILVVDALHHFADVDGTIEEAARVLRPGGVLVIREFDAGTLRGKLLSFFERLVGFDSEFFTPTELAARAEAAGLDAALSDTAFNFTLAAVKPTDPNL